MDGWTDIRPHRHASDYILNKVINVKLIFIEKSKKDVRATKSLPLDEADSIKDLKGQW